MKWPMKPIDLPSTKSPLSVPLAIYSSASLLVNAPQLRRRSTKQTAMQPSTLRIKFDFFLVVIACTRSAYLRRGVDLNSDRAKSLMISTRLSGFSSDFTLCPIPGMSSFLLRMVVTNSSGMRPESKAQQNFLAASSRAPPNRGPMVNKPEHREETRSLPALAATMVLWAPETAGPWSAVTMSTISMNLLKYDGSFRRNQRSPSTPPIPRSCSNTVESFIPP
mmetsp:Transcript_16763/g.23477  ORF Transcript_16763/g.23477 Transcript_16763/m.23477 type:complete len:221 (+) Transcript_16763:378-1040(+)